MLTVLQRLYTDILCPCGSDYFLDSCLQHMLAPLQAVTALLVE
jgi:hypothetical protein